MVLELVVPLTYQLTKISFRVMPHFENAPIATRLLNGVDNFLDSIQTIANCDRIQAQKVLNLYLKLKVAKQELVSGVISVKHGIYLDKDVIQNAINQ